MRRVALATWDRPWPIADAENALLVGALESEGIEGKLVHWKGPQQDWAAFDACVIRTPWDYPDDPDLFLAWCHSVEAALPLWNPARVVRWNHDKRYLLDLAARGVPVLETILVERGGRLDLDAARAARGWEGLVVKPTIGAGGRGMVRADVHEVASAAAHLETVTRERAAIVQPYLASIETFGEISLVYVNREFSHAVRKIPSRGEWRVQAYYGGRAERHEPSPAEFALGRAALAAVDAPLLYARVDLVMDEDRPTLMELEVIEPFLFTDVVPEAADTVAQGIAARLA